jgi:hypothetical protein
MLWPVRETLSGLVCCRRRMDQNAFPDCNSPKHPLNQGEIAHGRVFGNPALPSMVSPTSLVKCKNTAPPEQHKDAPPRHRHLRRGLGDFDLVHTIAKQTVRFKPSASSSHSTNSRAGAIQSVRGFSGGPVGVHVGYLHSSG